MCCEQAVFAHVHVCEIHDMCTYLGKISYVAGYKNTTLFGRQRSNSVLTVRSLTTEQENFVRSERNHALKILFYFF